MKARSKQLINAVRYTGVADDGFWKLAETFPVKRNENFITVHYDKTFVQVNYGDWVVWEDRYNPVVFSHESFEKLYEVVE